MTEAQEQQRRQALARSGGVCETCGGPLTQQQGAHKIGNTIQNRKRYGDFIIDHPLNIAIVCSLKCNAAQDISKDKGKCIELCKEIYTQELKKYKPLTK